MNRGLKCNICDPRSCRAAYLYVMRDNRLGLTKIGCTQNLSQRTSHYRANGADYMERMHSRVAGCRWSGPNREAKALRLLAARAGRVRGDWFDCDPEIAIACVEAACAGYSGERWK